MCSLYKPDRRRQSEAVGGERSRVYYVGFRGDRISPTKETTTTLQVPAPTAGDARVGDEVGRKTGLVQ